MTTQDTFSKNWKNGKPPADEGFGPDTAKTEPEAETPYQLGMKRWKLAKEGWAKRHEAAKDDLRMVSGDQWPVDVREARIAAGLPCPTFNREKGTVLKITNAARQQRKVIKVNAVSEAKDETADVYGGIIRHINYRSQGDVARDHAVFCAAGGSMGYYRVTSEYLPGTMDQDLCIKRILDPMSVYFDPAAVEPDLSDAMFCFVREYMTWDAYRRKFGDTVSTQSIDDCQDSKKDWGNDDKGVWVAEYWKVTIKINRLVRLAIDGSLAYVEDITNFTEEMVMKDADGNPDERDEEVRELECSYLNGEEELNPTPYDGIWIPILPTMGQEMVVDGERKVFSSVRDTHDAQRLLNGFKTGLTTAIATSNNTPWVGYKGSFKDPSWKNANRVNYGYLEVEMQYDEQGRLVPMPERIQPEPAIQALTQAAIMSEDDIRQSTGYSDAAIQPSKQADLSGIAIGRRAEQVELINFHFGDNLDRTIWHEGRILLDLIPKRYTSARAVRILGMDGAVSMVAVTQALAGGDVPIVPGFTPEEHHRLDVGIYDVTVTTGESTSTKMQEQGEQILKVMGIPPEIMSVYGDVLFEALGQPELAERADYMLLPAIRQAKASKSKIPPGLQATMAQQQQEIQELKQMVQTLTLEKAAKMAEITAKGKVDLTKQAQGDATKVVVAQIAAQSREAVALVDHHFEAAKHMIDLDTQAANADIDADRADTQAEADRQAAKEKETTK